MLGVVGSLSLACSSSGQAPPPQAPSAERAAPSAPSYQLGAARDTRYKADVDVERMSLRLVVREESLCDVIPIQTVVQNGERKRVAGPPTSTKPCDQRFARNVDVSLAVDGNTYALGQPNARGEIYTQIGDRMMQSLYGDRQDQVPVAHVLVRDRTGETQDVGTVELTELVRAQQRMEQLLAEFRAVLDRPQEQLSGAELARAYELYEQLAAFGSDDPRVSGLSALFLERLYQRKANEASERYRRNLEALAAAKDIFSQNRTVIVVPPYVGAALDSGSLDARTVDWARGQAAIALRRNRQLCGEGPKSGFRWAQLELHAPPPQSRLAFEILRFAYDDPYQAELTALCQRLYGSVL